MQKRTRLKSPSIISHGPYSRLQRQYRSPCAKACNSPCPQAHPFSFCRTSGISASRISKVSFPALCTRAALPQAGRVRTPPVGSPFAAGILYPPEKHTWEAQNGKPASAPGHRLSVKPAFIKNAHKQRVHHNLVRCPSAVLLQPEAQRRIIHGALGAGSRTAHRAFLLPKRKHHLPALVSITS